MKTKEIAFDAEELIGSVEALRDALKSGAQSSLRIRQLPKPAPKLSPAQVGRIRARLKVSQPVFAAMLNVPTVTAISWEKGRRKPSGAALRLLEIARRHPEVLAPR
jgi:putative transcriptional regulator